MCSTLDNSILEPEPYLSIRGRVRFICLPSGVWSWNVMESWRMSGIAFLNSFGERPFIKQKRLMRPISFSAEWNSAKFVQISLKGIPSIAINRLPIRSLYSVVMELMTTPSLMGQKLMGAPISGSLSSKNEENPMSILVWPSSRGARNFVMRRASSSELVTESSIRPNRVSMASKRKKGLPP